MLGCDQILRSIQKSLFFNETFGFSLTGHAHETRFTRCCFFTIGNLASKNIFRRFFLGRVRWSSKVPPTQNKTCQGRLSSKQESWTHLELEVDFLLAFLAFWWIANLLAWLLVSQPPMIIEFFSLIITLLADPTGISMICIRSGKLT